MNQRLEHTRALSPLRLCVLLCLAATSAQSASATNNLDDVEVITVSASKQNLGLNEVAASLSVIDAESIQGIEAQHINQVLSRVAGTWISRGNGQEHLTALRSPVLTGAGSCGEFFMALDGISLRAPGFCNTNQLFDANTEQAGRIEMLKGPASTLYGSNALHGVINIISTDAFDSQGNQIRLQAGAYDFARASGQFNWQNDSQAFSLLSHIEQENGFQTQSGYDQQKATLIYQQKGKVWDNKTVVDIANLNQETAGFIRGFEAFKDSEIRRINPNPEAFRDAKSLRAYSQFTRSLGTGDLSVKPYVRWNEMAFLQHFLPWQALEENAHTSAGVQTQYDFDFAGANWISGVDIDLTNASLQETQENDFSPNIPAGEHYDYDVRATVLAAFTQAQWRWDNLSLIAGGRLERTEYDYDNRLSDGSACAPEVAVCRFSRPADQTRSFSAFSPSITLEYQASDELLSYAKYSQGFRAPQATELFRLQNNQVSTDLDEVTMDAFELGLRYTNQQHRIHIAAYDMLKDNVIIRDTERQFVADGKTAHQGFEVEYQWQANENLSIASNLTLQKHTYESDLAISNTSIRNNRVDTAPDQLFGVQALYAPNEKFSAELSLQYLSEYFLDPENTAEYDGHTLTDLSLRYALNNAVSVKLDIFNLADEDYAERADFAFGGYRYFVGQPRRAFVSVSWLL